MTVSGPTTTTPTTPQRPQFKYAQGLEGSELHSVFTAAVDTRRTTTSENNNMDSFDTNGDRELSADELRKGITTIQDENARQQGTIEIGGNRTVLKEDRYGSSQSRRFNGTNSDASIKAFTTLTNVHATHSSYDWGGQQATREAQVQNNQRDAAAAARVLLHRIDVNQLSATAESAPATPGAGAEASTTGTATETTETERLSGGRSLDTNSVNGKRTSTVERNAQGNPLRTTNYAEDGTTITGTTEVSYAEDGKTLTGRTQGTYQNGKLTQSTHTSLAGETNGTITTTSYGEDGKPTGQTVVTPDGVTYTQKPTESGWINTQHVATNGNVSRTYTYDEQGTNPRLTSTTVGEQGQDYTVAINSEGRNFTFGGQTYKLTRVGNTNNYTYTTEDNRTYTLTFANENTLTPTSRSFEDNGQTITETFSDGNITRKYQFRGEDTNRDITCNYINGTLQNGTYTDGKFTYTVEYNNNRWNRTQAVKDPTPDKPNSGDELRYEYNTNGRLSTLHYGGNEYSCEYDRNLDSYIYTRDGKNYRLFGNNLYERVITANGEEYILGGKRYKLNANNRLEEIRG